MPVTLDCVHIQPTIIYAMTLRTCITPQGFRLGVHSPAYDVANIRSQDHLASLGRDQQDQEVENHRNFPHGDVHVDQAAVIYEIPNAFPFRGTTYIDSAWAGSRALDPASIALPQPEEVSMSRVLAAWRKTENRGGDGRQGEQTEQTEQTGQTEWAGQAERAVLFRALPRPLLLALATTSTDSRDLEVLAALSCELLWDARTALPSGLRYLLDSSGRTRPMVRDHELFEAVANNRYLPPAYKDVMVLRPGAQGGSEVVGDIRLEGGQTHVFEYLRRNSYIPWGHYAANMAHDAVRYAVEDLSQTDLQGLRHLYYQRTYVRLAEDMGLETPRARMLTRDELEGLRIRILERFHDDPRGDWPFTATLWGWNFGFDFAPSGYRLHASHQQVHQQYALVPGRVSGQAREGQDELPAYACGDLVAEAVARYRQENGSGLFDDYERAVRANQRTDAGNGESSLMVYEDAEVMLFVPKAQAVGFELQLMPRRAVGNVLEADTACRDSLDAAMLKAQQALAGLGARMVTSIEYSRRFDAADKDQRLLYAFLPKLPYAPGGFSEAQLRCIVGHYPEDFALACRQVLVSQG